jgi:hypothetical protein
MGTYCSVQIICRLSYIQYLIGSSFPFDFSVIFCIHVNFICRGHSIGGSKISFVPYICYHYGGIVTLSNTISRSR